MGVKGLQRHARHNNFQQVASLSAIALERASEDGPSPSICVDGSGLVHFLYSYPHPFISAEPLNWALGGQYSEFERVIVRFVSLFEQNGIRLVFMFDGMRCELKRKTSLDRRATDAKTVSTHMENITSLPNRCSTAILPLLALESMVQTLKELKVEIHFSEYEADKDIALYCVSHEECIGVLAKDSDFLIFDMGEKLYFNLDGLEFRLHEGIKREDRTPTEDPCDILCEVYNARRTAQMLKLDVKRLPLLAALVGNDFTASLNMQLIHSLLGVHKNKGVDPIQGAMKYLALRDPAASDTTILSSLFKHQCGEEAASTLVKTLLGAIEAYSLRPIAISGEKEEGLKGVETVKEAVLRKYKTGEYTLHLVSALQDKEFWGRVVMQDFKDFDAYEVMAPLRERMYGILLQGEKGQKQVALYSQSPMTFKKKRTEVPALVVRDIEGKETRLPPFAELLRNDEEKKEQRLATFLRLALSEAAELMQLPESYRTGCFLLRLLILLPLESRPGKKPAPLLCEWEFDAFIELLLRLAQPAETRQIVIDKKNKEAATKKKEEHLSRSAKQARNKRKRAKRARIARGVSLGTVYQVGLLHLYMLDQVCGSPISLGPPKQYYDGILWDECYRHTFKREKYGDLHEPSPLFMQLKQTILVGLEPENATFRPCEGRQQPKKAAAQKKPVQQQTEGGKEEAVAGSNLFSVLQEHEEDVPVPEPTTEPEPAAEKPQPVAPQAPRKPNAKQEKKKRNAKKNKNKRRQKKLA